MAEELGSDLEGRELTNVRGERLGKIDTLFTYGEVDRPNWARAKLGRIGLHKVIVPLETAEEVDGKVCLPYESEHVENAPEIKMEGEELNDEQIDLLCRHYGLERVTAPSGMDEDDVELPRETRDAKPPALDESDDSELVQRRRERMEELDVPDDQEPETAEPADEEDAPEPGSAEHEPETAMPEEARKSDAPEDHADARASGDAESEEPETASADD